MEFISVDDIIQAHDELLQLTGGMAGLRDLGALESATAQPMMTFGGQDLYPSLEEKAAALAFSLKSNHPFVDGNKRVGHAAAATFLRLNGYRIVADVDDQEAMILAVASGQATRDDLLDWLRKHIRAIPISP